MGLVPCKVVSLLTGQACKPRPDAPLDPVEAAVMGSQPMCLDDGHVLSWVRLAGHPLGAEVQRHPLSYISWRVAETQLDKSFWVCAVVPPPLQVVGTGQPDHFNSESHLLRTLREKHQEQ